jgi:hypothetical protein
MLDGRSCFVVEQPDRLGNKPATRRHVITRPSPIRAMLSLAERPNETIDNVFFDVVASRKSLPGERFVPKDRSWWWCLGCRSFSICGFSRAGVHS